MSSNSAEHLDRNWANETLLAYGLEELVDFLVGNPSPTWDLAVWCSEEHIPKLINAVVAAVDTKYDDLSEELVMTALRGLSYRYKSKGLPDSLGTSIVAAMRHHAAKKCPLSQWPDIEKPHNDAPGA